MASRKFVFPWPFSPTSASPSAAGSRSTRRRLRKSRIDSRCSQARAPADTVADSATVPVIATLPPGELRGALLQKGTHPFAHVGGGGEEPEVVGLEREPLVEGYLEPAIHCLDAQRHCQGALGQDLPQHGACS